MRAGDAVLMTVGGIPLEHLWILITDPDPVTHEGVIVSVTTLRNNCDRTVILRKGDHPFIAHDSVIQYSDALLIDTRLIDAKIASGKVCRRQPCSASLLREIRCGALSSPHTTRKILRFCQASFG